MKARVCVLVFLGTGIGLPLLLFLSIELWIGSRGNRVDEQQRANFCAVELATIDIAIRSIAMMIS